MCEGSKVRYFYFWCERCPTRITVETEVPSAAPEGEPEYSFAECEWVGLAQMYEPADGDSEDPLIPADLCPACGSQLHDLDDLVARGLVRMDASAERVTKAHTEWRAMVK